MSVYYYIQVIVDFLVISAWISGFITHRLKFQINKLLAIGTIFRIGNEKILATIWTLHIYGFLLDMEDYCEPTLSWTSGLYLRLLVPKVIVSIALSNHLMLCAILICIESLIYGSTANIGEPYSEGHPPSTAATSAKLEPTLELHRFLPNWKT